MLPYILFEKYIFLFQHWKWPAQGTCTVPIVTAHYRSLYCFVCVCGGKSFSTLFLDVSLFSKSARPNGGTRVETLTGSVQNLKYIVTAVSDTFRWPNFFEMGRV